MARIIASEAFVWCGLDLHFAGEPVLTLVPDATYPHLYRITYPNGWQSSPANLSRARDAAPGHARYLLGEEAGAVAAYSPETEVALTLPPDASEAA